MSEEAFEPVTWFIDRNGDRNMNPFSINSIASIAIMDYFGNTIANELNNFIINYEHVPPTIPFTPLAEVIVVQNMALTEEENECCVCQQDDIERTEICRLNCTHTFCGSCVKILMNRHNPCPLCRAEIRQICVQTEENREKFE